MLAIATAEEKNISEAFSDGIGLRTLQHLLPRRPLGKVPVMPDNIAVLHRSIVTVLWRAKTLSRCSDTGNLSWIRRSDG